MGDLLTLFFKRTCGSIAVMGAMFVGVIALTTAFSIDYSRSINGRAKMQRAADAATLVAAATYRDDTTKNKSAALKRANEYFDNAVGRIDNAKFTRSFELEEQASDGEITAKATIDVTFDSLFTGGVAENVMKSSIESLTIIKHTPQDLYLVLLVDSTASMNLLIASVRDAARNLETEVRAKLLLKGLEFNQLYVKVAFFGDLRTDKQPYGWRESPLYDFAKEVDVVAFRNFVATTPTYYGGDEAESSPAAIAHFLTAALPTPLKQASTVQSIVVWTDAPGLPFSHPKYKADVTVELYKRFGNLGEMPSVRTWGDFYRYNSYFNGYGWITTSLDKYYYDEDAEYDGDTENKGNTGTKPLTYGCCSTFEVFKERWHGGGAVPLSRRTLGLIVPLGKEPWTTMADWPGIVTRNYATPSASGIVDDVVDSLNSSYSPLAVAR